VELRELDGSNDLYLGVVAPPTGTSQDTQGVALLGRPASVVLERNFFERDWSVAHEIGHNFNLRHAPACEADDPDPDFPSSEGQIVVPGYDINRGTNLPREHSDYMGYCGGENVGVSDYHFRSAMQFRRQLSPAGDALAGPGLLVSGNYRDGEWTGVSMIPTSHFRIEHPREEEAFEFTAWTAGADQTVRQRFSLHTITDTEDGQTFAFVIPRPVGGIDHYQIESREHGVEVAETIRHSTLQVQPSVTWSGDSAVIDWPVRPTSALVVRDSNNTIVAVDRTGALQLRAIEALSFQLHQGGQMVGAGRSHRPPELER